ncbi:hypothetical protein EAG21025_21840 [Enterobacter asburiae]
MGLFPILFRHSRNERYKTLIINMIKIVSRRLQHCNEVATSISNASPTQLQQLKTELADEMGKPVGLHTMGIPAAISTLGVIVSFAIPQLWLGYGILAGLNQPAEHVFVWVVLIALLFAGLNGRDDVYDWQRQHARREVTPYAGGDKPGINSSLSAGRAER